MSIPIKVTDRILEIDLLRVDPLVCANQYTFAVTFDAEWESITQRYARIRFGGQYYEIPFTGTTFTANTPAGVPMIEIGIYGGTVATSVKRVPLLGSVLDSQGQMVEFDSELYDQWNAAVTALLTDDALDSSSAHPVANSVITPLLNDAVYKSGNVAQTITNDVAITGKLDAMALKVVASYNSSVTSGRFLRLYRFVRPAGAKWRVNLRLVYRNRAGYDLIQICGAYANGEVSDCALSVMTSWNHKAEYSLTYDSGNDRFDLYLKASGTVVRPIDLILEDGTSDDGVVQPAMVGSMGSSTSRTGTEVAFAAPVSMNFSLAPVAGKSNYSSAPWHRVAYTAIGGTGVGRAGLFFVSTNNPALAEMFGIFHVYQRTASTPSLGMRWIAGYGINADSWAVVQRDGNVEIWYKQTVQYGVTETSELTGWGSNASFVQWTIGGTDEQETAAALPSGDGIYSATSVISPLTVPASLSMMNPNALQGMALNEPDIQTDGDGDRGQEGQR